MHIVAPNLCDRKYLGSLWNTGYEKYGNRKNIGIEMVCFYNPIGIENIGIEMRNHLAAS
jgi:hypothetical protein